MEGVGRSDMVLADQKSMDHARGESSVGDGGAKEEHVTVGKVASFVSSDQQDAQVGLGRLIPGGLKHTLRLSARIKEKRASASISVLGANACKRPPFRGRE